MDILISNFRKKMRKAHNKKGMTMFSLFLIIVVIIFLTIIFSNPDFIRKINRGRVTTAWANELSSLSNGILSLNNHVNVLYPIRLKGDASNGLDVVIPSPPLSAYESVKDYKILSGTTGLELKFDHKSTVTATLTGSGAITSVSSPSGKPTTPPANDAVQLEGLSRLGSNGITPFVNKSIPNIEESLFLGLMNQNNTDLGIVFSETGKLDLDLVARASNNLLSCDLLGWSDDPSTTGSLECKSTPAPSKKTELEAFISMVFGIGTTKDLQSPKPTSWVSIKPVDSSALHKAVGGSYRFYGTEDYNLFWVDAVAPKADAIAIFEDFFKFKDEAHAKKYVPNTAITGSDLSPAVRELAGQIYDRMLSFVQPDSLIVMPTTKSGAVYSSNSDFRLYKFSTSD